MKRWIQLAGWLVALAGGSCAAQATARSQAAAGFQAIEGPQPTAGFQATGVTEGTPDTPVQVLEAPDTTAKGVSFRDPHFKVKFQVPPGWEFTTKDGEVSLFHADVITAPAGYELRAVASMDFNPFPQSTLGGAMFYFSVGLKTSADECKQQAPLPPAVQDIGGMKFAHIHDERGDMCTEVRDEVYTAFRKGSCYRFDLKINTFCAESSGAQDLTDRQLIDIEERMTGILSTVELGWAKGGAHFVPVPEAPAAPGQPATSSSKPVAAAAPAAN